LEKIICSIFFAILLSFFTFFPFFQKNAFVPLNFKKKSEILTFSKKFLNFLLKHVFYFLDFFLKKFEFLYVFTFFLKI